MSLPSFPVVNPPIEREDAVNQILSSIAMEELGLSHILTSLMALRLATGSKIKNY